MKIYSQHRFSALPLLLNLRFAEDDAIQKVVLASIAAACTVIVTSGDRRWIGSGFHLGSGLVVTASHVAPPENETILLTFDGKRQFQAQVVLSDPEVDAAILYCPEAASEISKVALGDSDHLRVFDKIAVIGSPEGWQDTAADGRITNLHQSLGENAPSPAWNEIFFISADILEGDSGGMVIGEDGLVYGMVMGVAGTHAELGLGQRAVCPSNKIKGLLERLMRQGE